MKCEFCRAVDIRKTGHREDCKQKNVIPPIVRVASPKNSEPELMALVKTLVSTIRKQEERIAALEEKIK